MVERASEKPWRQQIADVRELFGRRNALYMFNRDVRYKFLGNAIRNLQSAVRSRSSRDVLRRELASVFARMCTYAESFGVLNVCEAFTRKYPLRFCTYCLMDNGSCNCLTNRDKTKKPQLAPIDEEMANFSVRKLCAVMDDKYGKRNREHEDPAAFAIGRLQEEVYETTDIDLFIQNTSLTQLEIRQRLELEFADMFAWIFSIAAILLVDLESELQARYGSVHERCGKRPCICSAFQHYASEVRSGGMAETRSVPQ